MGDVSLHIEIPHETPRRGSRWRWAALALGLAVAVLAGVTIDPFSGESKPSLSSVDGKRFWSSGDSTSYYMSIALTNRLVESGAIPVQDEPEYVNASGLLSRDFFDWQAEIEAVASDDPDIVFFMIGANDAREGLDLDTYRTDVAAIMDALRRDGRTVIWVGQPNMEDPDRAARVQAINSIFRSEAGKWEGVRYVDTWEATSGPDGSYAQSLEIDGELTQIREDDGLHFTLAGGALLARVVIEAAFSE